MSKPYANFLNDGTLVRAGTSVASLCRAWNRATNPEVMMCDEDHARARTYARAIERRMSRLGFVRVRDFVELSNGTRVARSTETEHPRSQVRVLERPTRSAALALTAADKAFEAAESFIAGFEGDECQEGIDALLSEVREARELLQRVYSSLALSDSIKGATS